MSKLYVLLCYVVIAMAAYTVVGDIAAVGSVAVAQSSDGPDQGCTGYCNTCLQDCCPIAVQACGVSCNCVATGMGFSVCQGQCI